MIIHSKERRRTTNTGLLAVKALVNSEIFVRGDEAAPFEPAALLNNNYRTLLFFPSDNARELTPEYVATLGGPIQLLVPDGNWRQASKVHHRYAELADLPRVMIKAPNLATEHLRAETTTEGMSTLQAIAFALGAIEGPEVQAELLKLYELKLRRTLEGRQMPPKI